VSSELPRVEYAPAPGRRFPPALTLVACASSVTAAVAIFAINLIAWRARLSPAIDELFGRIALASLVLALVGGATTIVAFYRRPTGKLEILATIASAAYFIAIFFSGR
jgi:hypothetical protein